MAETFSYDLRVGASGTVTQRTWVNEFGDGYTQSGGVGINNKSESWDVSRVGRLKVGDAEGDDQGDDLQLIRDFLDRQEGYKSFLWTPPGGKQGRYRAKDYKLETMGGGYFTLSTTFAQVFNP